MRACALCKEKARAFCESDQARLCWSCDAKVHGANFIVARHSRTLLCHACQSLTPWKASGPKLGGRTVSFCDSCLQRRDSKEGGGDNEDHEDEDDDDDEQEERSEGEGDVNGGGGSDEMEEGEDGTEEGDNQVVPWSSPFTSTNPPPPASCSSSEEDDLAGSGSFCCSAEAEVDEVGMRSPMFQRTAKDSAGLPSQGLIRSPARQIRRPSYRKDGKTRSPGNSIQSWRPLKYRKAVPGGGVQIPTYPDGCRQSPNPNLSGWIPGPLA